MTRLSKMLAMGAFIPVAGVLFAQKALKVDVDLVMVNVTVSDPDNKLITDLKLENFQLFEDKVEQEIKYFSSEAAPLSLGIVFDISRSMENKIDLASDAAARFQETWTPDDQNSLVELCKPEKRTV